MRFLISMVFVGMLALSSQAYAEPFSGKEAERVLLHGEIVASKWDTELQDLHLTRVVYKKRLYACRSFTNRLRLEIICDMLED